MRRLAARRRRRSRPPATDVGLVILDLGLPDIDGIDVCRRLRAARPDLAILILTARDQELDVVAGLDAGADDYLVKPFRLAELLARVRAHLRRAAAAGRRAAREPLRAGDVVVDRAARRAWRGGEELDAAPEGVRPARAARRRGRPRGHARADHARGLGHRLARARPRRSTRTCSTLRHKLGADAITTLRGVGYRFEAP